jgi:hypothetical protein
MALVTTLFPRLPRRHAHLFRETLAVGVLLVILLAALRLYTPTLIAAAALLPILYVLYLHEVEVWEAGLATNLIATFGIGAALGVGYSLGFGHLVKVSLDGTRQGPAFSGILLPVVAQLLMLIGPLLLLRRTHFAEALDGLSFGVTSALGFTLASVVAGYWHTITAPLLGASSVSTEEIAGLLRATILAGVVNAATTAIFTTCLWLRHHGRSRKRHDHLLLRLPAAIIIAFGFQVVLGIATYFITSLLLVVILWLVAAAILLEWVRLTVHHALLEEGAEVVIGEPSACPECHLLVPTMYFCPACGAARSAAPKHTRPQIGSLT